MADLSGTWLGTYWQNGIPTRFEVTLLQSGNSLSGNILDDNNMGEASLVGDVVGRRVDFTKSYITGTRHSVFYTGTVSKEENSMQGQWLIDKETSGSWEAHRSGDNLIAELQSRLSKKEPATVGASR